MTWLPRLPLRAAEATTDIAERLGFDCGYNGPDESNCHFTLFATPELTAAWERGKKRGEDKRSDIHEVKR